MVSNNQNYVVNNFFNNTTLPIIASILSNLKDEEDLQNAFRINKRIFLASTRIINSLEKTQEKPFFECHDLVIKDTKIEDSQKEIREAARHQRIFFVAIRLLKTQTYTECTDRLNSIFENLFSCWQFLNVYQSARNGSSLAQSIMGFAHENVIRLNEGCANPKLFELYNKCSKNPLLTSKSANDFYWYKSAAEQNHPFSQFKLGLIIEQRNYLKDENDFKQALVWFQKAANQGFGPAQFKVGMYFKEGLILSESYEEAVKWFQKAADQGFALAQFHLAACYHDGEGITQSFIQAFHWYQKAADQGLMEAQYCLGVCYEKGIGVNQSWEEAAKWYKKAGAKFTDHSEYAKGLSYETGSNDKQSWENAAKCYRELPLPNENYKYRIELKWIKIAANMGNASAQSILAESIYVYNVGPSKDYFTLKNKAAEQGHPDGLFQIAQIYECPIASKVNGVIYSIEKAEFLYYEAIKEGEKISYSKLGSLCGRLAFKYQYGKGVKQSKEKEIEFYLKAASLWDEFAYRNLSDLQLTESQQNVWLKIKEKFKF